GEADGGLAEDACAPWWLPSGFSSGSSTGTSFFTKSVFTSTFWLACGLMSDSNVLYPGSAILILWAPGAITNPRPTPWNSATCPTNDPSKKTAARDGFTEILTVDVMSGRIPIGAFAIATCTTCVSPGC